MDEQERYKSARNRVREIRGFYTHALVYVLVNTGLFLVNVFDDSPGFWFFWPLIGWGIGLVAHGASVFGPRRWWGAEWEERKIKELMDKDEQGG
jgi:hypothetical protein